MCVSITIIDDLTIEPNEQFTVMLESTDPAVQLTSPTATITILDSCKYWLIHWPASITIGISLRKVCYPLYAYRHTQYGLVFFHVVVSLQHPVFLLALLHAVLEVTVGWGAASVTKDVSDWITAAVTLLKYHAFQV